MAWPSLIEPFVESAPDRFAFLAELALEVGQVIEIVRRALRLGRRKAAHPLDGTNQPRDDAEILLHVRHNMQLPARSEDALTLAGGGRLAEGARVVVVRSARGG